jgi:cytochrome c oxidase cbb3-type subunit 3
MAKKRIDKPTGTQTVGHEWDGIEELDTPMPRWWLWIFFTTIIWGVVYVILYPAWPMIDRATSGVLGWSSRGQLAGELAREDVGKAAMQLAIASSPVERLSDDPALLQLAIEGGRSAFKVHCVQCHGSGAAGAKGYPNLNDDDWLWGGDVKSIHATITNGIRQPGLDKTHMSMMPAFGRDGILQPAQIEDAVSYVRFLSRQEAPTLSTRRGARVFAENCVACHGPDGKGLRQFGAPNLTDAIWLYGGDRASLRTTIHNSRNGVMPAWGLRLDPVTVKMLALYVHSLGGGEAMPEQAPAQASTQVAATAAKDGKNVQP